MSLRACAVLVQSIVRHLATGNSACGLRPLGDRQELTFPVGWALPTDVGQRSVGGAHPTWVDFHAPGALDAGFPAPASATTKETGRIPRMEAIYFLAEPSALSDSFDESCEIR